MIPWCVGLAFAGVVFMALEIFLPSFGVVGFLGLAALVISAVLAVLYVPFGWLFVLAEAALLVSLALWVWRYMRRKQLYGKLIMTDTLDEDAAPESPALQAGKEGVTLTALRPFGAAEFNGARVDVVSMGTYVKPDTRVKVCGNMARRIIVRPV